ncbi:MAG: sugar ABC transporter permease [Eubacteriales bacterium]
MAKDKILKKNKRQDVIWGWIFVLPMLIGLLTTNIIPIGVTIYQSFFKTGDFGRGNVFVGFDNYKAVLGNSELWRTLFNTLVYMVVEVPISIVIGLVLATMLNQSIKGRGIYRAIFFIPTVAAPSAVAMIWRWLLNSDYGLVNNLLNIKVNWLSNPDITIITIALVGVWTVLGYNIVIFLAGLQEIPHDYYEAAEIDGATSIKTFLYITVPLMSPSIFFVCITRIIAALKVFELIYMMVDVSNPALKNTQSLVYLFYRYTFTEKNTGYGATVAVVLLIITLMITAMQLKMQKKWVHYE